jgi:hypothetical protein
MVRMRFVVPAAGGAGPVGTEQATAPIGGMKYLSSVRAGAEIFTGEGTFDTSACSVRID